MRRLHKKLAHICPTYFQGPNQSFIRCTDPGKRTVKSTSDDANREKVHREIENIENLMKRKRISGTNNTLALDHTKLTVGNGNRGMGGGGVI